MKQISRNKSKSWRKTYGKPFLARRAYFLAKMALTQTAGLNRLHIIAQASGSSLDKGLAIADAALETAKETTLISNEIGKGFVGKY